MSDLATNPIDDTPIPPRSMKATPKYARDTDRPYVGDPWDVQPKEPARAFEAFTIYLKLEGSRSLIEVGRIFHEKYGLKTSNVYNWSRKHRWAERSEAFDSFMMAKQIRVLAKRRVEAAIRHADQAEAAQSIHMLPVVELRKRIAEQGGALDVIAELDDVSLMKLHKAMGGGAELAGLQKAERDAIGAGTDGGVGQDTKVIAERGAILKRVLGNPELVAMFERVTIEGSAETVDAETVED